MIKPGVTWTLSRPATRLTALVLVVVLAVTLSAPARAEADPFTALAIAGAAVVVVILVVYLIIANTQESRLGERQPVMIACLEGGAPLRTCWPLAQPAPSWDVESLVVLPQPEPQS